MSIIKPEALTSVGSHSQVRYPVPKSESTQVCVKSEGFTPSQPSIVRFPCEYCPREFSLKQYLIEHAHEAHSSLHTFCKPEQFRFALSIVKPENPDLGAYEQRTTSSRQTFVCHVCHKVFKSRGSLNGHMITHSNDRLFTCDK
eukprot:691893_1